MSDLNYDSISPEKEVHILLVDDDSEDCELIELAMRKNGINNPIDIYHNGEELLKYLNDNSSSNNPSLILLDLNMPKVNGFETLFQLKKNPRFGHIPVIVLTTSSSEEDVLSSYDLGACSFITKPSTVAELREIMGALKSFWLKAVTLPVPA
jgi:CheY-like chemotaxis protein